MLGIPQQRNELPKRTLLRCEVHDLCLANLLPSPRLNAGVRLRLAPDTVISDDAEGELIAEVLHQIHDRAHRTASGITWRVVLREDEDAWHRHDGGRRLASCWRVVNVRGRSETDSMIVSPAGSTHALKTEPPLISKLSAPRHTSSPLATGEIFFAHSMDDSGQENRSGSRANSPPATTDTARRSRWFDRRERDARRNISIIYHLLHRHQRREKQANKIRQPSDLDNGPRRNTEE